MLGSYFKLLLLLFAVRTVTARKPRFARSRFSLPRTHRSPVGIRFRFYIQNPTTETEMRSRNNYVIAVGSQITLVLFGAQNRHVVFKPRIRFKYEFGIRSKSSADSVLFIIITFRTTFSLNARTLPRVNDILAGYIHSILFCYFPSTK